MKVLIVSDYYQPVIGYNKVAISKALIKKGHDLRVLASDLFFPFPDYQKTVEGVLGPRKRPRGIAKENGVLVKRKRAIIEIFTRTLYFGVGEELKSFNPDLVIVFGASSFSCIQVSLQKLINNYKFKLVLADTHLASEYERENILLKKLFYSLFRVFFARIVNKATDKVIAMQEGTVKMVKNVYGITKNVKLLDQGTDHNLFRFRRSGRSLLRKKYKLRNSDFVVIYTGKVIRAKGVHLLFKAFNILAQKHSSIYLLIVGSGQREYRKKCLSYLDKDYHKRVFWVKFQPSNKLPDYYSFSDLAVWPLQESLSMNDAAACERVFIASNKMTSVTRISNNNALLYKKGNAEDLAVKIESMYNNPKKRKIMGKRGRKLVKEKLSWEKIAEGYL